MKPVILQPPIKIWYKTLPGFSKIIWPILDIKLSINSFVLPQPIFSLVDSGASISIIHPQIAEILGFDRERLGKSRSSGKSASGDYKSWILPNLVEVNIYGHLFNFRFEVLDNPNLMWPCILGEDSIFQVAKVDFSKFRGYFELRIRLKEDKSRSLAELAKNTYGAWKEPVRKISS
ncbi:retroviral-like aspartic protease family protein [Candidatus Curtissbacteria bacterium]|nr:retroviral-like aspartic protease family protein [Candidatus Curtissbacteria bacterium]